MTSPENPHAGRSAVVLDIGGDVGALIVTMPAAMADVEVEIIPSGTDRRQRDEHAHDHAHGDTHEHGHDAHEHGHAHEHAAAHEHPHTHTAGAPPHVAVVGRPTPDGRIIHSLVFGELVQGSYDLYVRPDGPIRLSATVRGGEVTEASWPGN